MALSLAPHIGMARIKMLKNHFGSAKAVFEQDIISIKQVENIGKQSAESIVKFNKWDEVEKIIASSGQYTLLQDEMPQFPAVLNELFDPPALLWIQGELQEEDQNAVAIVGTRKATDYGKRIAYQFAKELAERGITVVSGLALGIDTAAHQGALAGGGRTLAVLGSGLNNIYPYANLSLSKEIAKNGALISEFPPHTAPDSGNFPRRNRIISGLSRGILVAESHAKGGALLTAYLALEQNKEVFAIPNRITDAANGNNKIIQEGTAKLVTSVDDILIELDGLTQLPQAAKPQIAPPELNGIEATIYHTLSQDPLHLDQICFLTGLDASNALVYLLQLEFKGIVQQSAGRMFTTK